jgi:nicotinamidase/pyrazinamidase
MRIASFDVDAQKGFTPLCPDELPVPDGDKIVEELNLQATYANFRIGSKDAHPENAVWVADEENPMFSKMENEAECDMRWPAHCIVGTKGFELLDGLPKPLDYDFFVYKGIEKNVHPYGAIYSDLSGIRSTGVKEFLAWNRVDVIIVAGLATDFCVTTTAQQLSAIGIDVIVNLGACRGVAPDSTEKAISDMKDVGIVIVNNSLEIEKAIKEIAQ